jgi:hypothetical protein
MIGRLQDWKIERLQKLARYATGAQAWRIEKL